MPFIQLPGDSTGKLIETVTPALSSAGSTMHREVMAVGDFTTTAIATVGSTAGLSVLVTNPSTAVTVTNPSTSVTVTNISTAVTITNPTTAVNVVNTVTVLATAATNPWSSAPSFNLPVVSASSGTVQVLHSTAQAYSIFMSVTSSAGNQSTAIKGTPGVVYGYSIFNTHAAARFVKLFNTSSAPTVGTATPVITLEIPGSTAGAGAVQTFGPTGVAFSAGIGYAVVDGIGTTSTGAITAGDIAANIYYL